MSFEILAAANDWPWVYNRIIRERIWPLLSRMDCHPMIVADLLLLTSRLCRIGLSSDNSACTTALKAVRSRFENILQIHGPKSIEIQVAACEAILNISNGHYHLCTSVHEWLMQRLRNRNNGVAKFPCDIKDSLRDRIQSIIQSDCPCTWIDEGPNK